jgi:hypothetical protein
MTMETLAVVLIVKNEAARIAQALASVTGIADEIVVLDDSSTDRTVAPKASGPRCIPGGSMTSPVSARRPWRTPPTTGY